MIKNTSQINYKRKGVNTLICCEQNSFSRKIHMTRYILIRQENKSTMRWRFIKIKDSDIIDRDHFLINLFSMPDYIAIFDKVMLAGFTLFMRWLLCIMMYLMVLRLHVKRRRWQKLCNFPHRTKGALSFDLDTLQRSYDEHDNFKSKQSINASSYIILSYGRTYIKTYWLSCNKTIKR